ncbi:glycosyl hydrolase family 17 protein [Winogradskyella maritima]|nr:glycosyl hydrolase family 17 protein [Winogradskyella maritima]
MSCNTNKKDNQLKQTPKNVTAKDILGDSSYLAISYGGYRLKSRDSQPTIPQLKNDMLILSAMGIRVLRTYNVQLDHAKNVLKAIRELKSENPDFEMYVMLGAWIDCLNAWTDQVPNHNVESAQNEGEIARAVALANEYPEIVKIIAVGNEAMVKWATSYYVEPWVILKWVNHLQELKKRGDLPNDLWITSSDDFSSWGGGDSLYHTEDLEKLVKAVDYVSMHTYPYHNTHYNPQFWKVPAEDVDKPELDQINNAMKRAIDFSKAQYDSVSNYMASLGVVKPIHIGETGWATVSKGLYGPNGSRATDEYKQGLYYKMMREWTNLNGISCFYFEAFNEQWKDAQHPNGSENHFGLFKIDGSAKYPIWDLVDQGIFEGLTRNGNAIRKTYNGDLDALLLEVLVPPRADGALIHSVN